MMKRKERAFAAAAAVSLAMILTGGFVYARPSVETTQTFETGAVDIKLESLEENSRTAGTAGIEVLPGQNVRLDMNVRSKAESCYVRAKYEFDQYKDILDGAVYGIPDDWSYNPADGYWYCRKAVDTSETQTFFEGLTIPDDLPQEGNEGFSLAVTAEAVQQRNMDPDFTSSDPWKHIEAEYDVDVDYISTEFPASQKLSVLYEGNADRLIAAPDDFFSNLPVLMPGDVYEQSIELNNASDTPSDLYFYSLADDESILQKLILTISTDIGGVKKAVYTGSLDCKELEGGENEILLGRLNSRERGKMTFSLSMPETLRNRESLKAGRVKWIFSTEHIEEGKKIPRNGVYTGDRSSGNLWFVLMAAGCVLMAVTLILRKRVFGIRDL